MIVARPISATVCFCACHVYPHTGYKGVRVDDRGKKQGKPPHFIAQTTSGGTVRLLVPLYHLARRVPILPATHY